jgi:hypothetical protein
LTGSSWRTPGLGAMLLALRVLGTQPF